jgi:LemA protein
MKKSVRNVLFAGIGLIILVLIIFSFFSGNYNKMVRADENVSAQWGQVQNVYQRRFDLIPNLVATVQGYAEHESGVLTQVTEARSKAGGVMNISDEVLNDPEAFSRFQQAQSELGSALQRLLVVTENYPDLKANENFLALQDQLEGSENRIAIERQRFNEAVREYNSLIRLFPQSIIANMNGFEQKAYFAADESAQTAPKVEF